MVFSSQIFLFLFLPVALMGYYLICKIEKGGAKNLWLLLASILFYAYGEPFFVYVLLFASVFNWFMSKLISEKEGIRKNICFIIGLAGNSILLVSCKYTGFIIENVNTVFDLNITVPQLALPIGISFFTFQALSYIIDIYRGDAEVARTPLQACLYLMFFPQLIAGPIIRYKSIANEIAVRRENIDDFSDGIGRLIIGIGKKVLIANVLGETADLIFSGILEESVALYWLGAFSYMLQIYYDFSGYSDMAIGLGRMFGFHFKENFNYPYISKSITEFWRRWHISLGTWFKDYIYIPLGGSRVNKGRLISNLLIVWLLTGIWHGANWTFVVWGIYYFVFLTVEKIGKRQIEKIPEGIRYIMTILIVLVGWIIFRSDSIGNAVIYIQKMIGLKNTVVVNNISYLYFKENVVILLIGIIFSFPLSKKLRESLEKYSVGKYFFEFGKCLGLAIILMFSISFLVKGAYNPFIYFNF
ncbi:MBOAT family protein [Lachnospiraceae bacterium]|nr:MBOAT family protein [Lachnospiraceae bacterium]